MSEHIDATVEREYCIELPADVVDAIRERVAGADKPGVAAVDAAFDHLETSHRFVTPDGRDLEDAVADPPRSA
jgi:hypothetical protein